VITSYAINAAQQVQTIRDQDVEVNTTPTPDALTESWSVQRKTTAKASVTVATVDSVFPEPDYKVERTERILPFKFRTAVPLETTEQTLAGTASLPTLSQNDWLAEDHQLTEFKHRTTTSSRTPNLPVTLIEYKISGEQQLITITDTWDAGIQTLTPDALTI